MESGEVESKLRTLEGTYTGEEKPVDPGEAVLIHGSDDFSEFVVDDSGEAIRHFDLANLPEDNTERLIALIPVSADNEET